MGKSKNNHLGYPFVAVPFWMVDDKRLNLAAIRLYMYLYRCEFQNRIPDIDDMRDVIGRRPYSKDDSSSWRPASKQHLKDTLNELEAAGYLTWRRGAPIHQRFSTQPGAAEGHEHGQAGHDHVQMGHEHGQAGHDHVQMGHEHGPHPYIESFKNPPEVTSSSRASEDDDERARDHSFELNEQGGKLIVLGFSKKVAREFQNLPAHQFEKIVARAQKTGSEHNGATVQWARAQVSLGWPEQPPERRWREPRQDLDDIPEEWRGPEDRCKGNGWDGWEDTSVPDFAR